MFVDQSVVVLLVDVFVIHMFLTKLNEFITVLVHVDRDYLNWLGYEMSSENAELKQKHFVE
jgi:hypothetical protein